MTMKFNTAKAIEFLLARGHLPVLYWLKRDILEVPVDREVKNMRKFAARVRILETQKPDGSWWEKRSDTPVHWERTLYRVETLRNLSRLYDYGCTIQEEGVQKAVNFLYSLQTKEGDFRGTVLNEHTPTFHALALEMLCRYGLDKDRRVQKGFRWILANRQKDGGWALYLQPSSRPVAQSSARSRSNPRGQPFKPRRTQPFSHHVTGIILRALAESPTWKNSKEARQAGEKLLSCFFCDEVFEDRTFPSDWEKICYPFWNIDILGCLDSLSKVGFGSDDETIQKGLEWLQRTQNSQGFWECGNKKATLEDHLWVTMAVLRVLKRFDLLRA
ncbi:MAG: prenyltransferase/squalene oxidase repeat-containing protein [Candidatus Aminicenantales bacterium]